MPCHRRLAPANTSRAPLADWMWLVAAYKLRLAVAAPTVQWQLVGYGVVCFTQALDDIHCAP